MAAHKIHTLTHHTVKSAVVTEFRFSRKKERKSVMSEKVMVGRRKEKERKKNKTNTAKDQVSAITCIRTSFIIRMKY